MCRMMNMVRAKLIRFIDKPFTERENEIAKKP